ncbi:MAG: leucine-rich repeat protein [Clostridia bacterium]|nr:leucine-rich repeat protein [Clostridia bacterium]
MVLVGLVSCMQTGAPSYGKQEDAPAADENPVVSAPDSTLPQNVDKMEVTMEDGYTYTITVKNGKANIIDIRYGEYYSKESDEPLVIPAEIAGYPVTGIDRDSLTRKQAKEIVFPTSLEVMLAAFYRSSATTVFLPKNVREVGQLGYKCALSEVRVDEENAFFCAVDGVLYDKEMTTLIYFPEGKYVSEYEVPQSVTKISNVAFGRRVELDRLVIGEQVTEIGEGLFYGTVTFKAGFTLAVREGSVAHRYAKDLLELEDFDFSEQIQIEILKD